MPRCPTTPARAACNTLENPGLDIRTRQIQVPEGVQPAIQPQRAHHVNASRKDHLSNALPSTIARWPIIVPLHTNAVRHVRGQSVSWHSGQGSGHEPASRAGPWAVMAVARVI